MIQITDFLIIDSKDKSILLKLTTYEPNIIDIKKNIIINEIKSTMHPFFLLTSNDKILLNLSGMTNNI